MSKRYRKNDNTVINITLVAIVVVAIFPLMPITCILMSIFYILNIKGKYVLYIASIITIIVVCIDIHIIISLFSNIYTNLLVSINNIIHHNLWSVFTVYKNFSIGDWLILVVISMFLASYFLSRIERQKRTRRY